MKVEDTEMISAEEFFGEIDNEATAGQRPVLAVRNRRGDKLFEETKIRMVMRIHKLSRIRARKMIEEIQKRCADERQKKGRRD